jgi:chemotaxis protein MotB
MADNKRPIIVRKKKIVGGGHHGGAWKVAYADFVTAMMAFFMLMWLLNATTDKQRRGLADYFSPTLPIRSESSGGDGALGGRSLAADTLNIQMGSGGITESTLHGTTEAEDAVLRSIEAAVLGKGGDSLVEEDLLRHVATRMTDEGLVIELFDLPGSPLFVVAEPTTVLHRLLAAIAAELSPLTNGLALEAHTASAPIIVREPGLWRLSTDRAQAVRDALLPAGIDDTRVKRVTGHADRRPAASDPMAARNARVELIVMRLAAARR